MILNLYSAKTSTSNPLLLICFVMLIIFTSINRIFAQEGGEIPEVMTSTAFKNSRIIPPSPEAAGLGKFGNIPVSLFTGTPKVSVPFYELKGNSLSVSVQLSYNAGGFNPQEIAGWTGLNWNLIAGGVITRSVVGNPDVSANYFRTPSPLDVPITTDMIVYNEYLNKLRKGDLEAQPDMYFFNFNGYSGKFMIKPDGSVIMLEKNNLKITHCVNNCSPAQSSFTVTDPSGNIYLFNTVEISTTTTDDVSTDVPTLQHTYASSWFLTSITSADYNEEIIFNYHSLTQQHYPYSYAAPNQSKVYEFIFGIGSPPNISFLTSNPPVTGIQRRYLQKITLKRNAHEISYVQIGSTADQRQDLGHLTNEFPGERMVNDIKVFTRSTNLSFVLFKQYNFSYSYFTNSLYPNHWQYKRLKLDQIQEVSTNVNTTNPPPYSFEYNTSNATPPLGTAGIDHWGFGNGINQYTTTPESNYMNSIVVINGSNRAPALVGSSALMLTKIKYPTGGNTSFEYELNQGFAPDGVGIIDVGGLRIKRMIDYSFENQKAIEKTYEYTLENGTTSGKTKYPAYKNVSTYIRHGQQLGGWFDPCYGAIDMQKQTVTVSASSVMGLGSIMGGHIGYSRVTEKQVDISNGQPLGKTVYEYETNGQWGEMNNDDGKNGELLKQVVFDNGGKIIQSLENQYDYVMASGGGALTSISAFTNPDQDNKIILIKSQHNQSGAIGYIWLPSQTCLDQGYTMLDARIYTVKLFPYGISYGTINRKLVQQTTKTYDQISNSYMTSLKKYTYGNPLHSLPTSIEQKTNNNEVVITNKKYPQDYTITGTPDVNTQGITMLKNKNIVGAEIESYQYRQNTDGSNKRYLGGVISNYTSSFPYPTNLWRIETAQPLTSFTESSVTNGVFSFHSTYKQMGAFRYGTNGTLVQQTKNQDIPASYIWSYYNNLPSAEVTNATADAIAYTSFETDEGGNWNSTNGFLINRVFESVTGNYSLNVGGATISKTGLPQQKYIVSYWSKNGALAVSPAPTSTKTGLTVGAFTYYEHLLPLTTSVNLQGGATIDELRLYPEKALMSTTTYNFYTGQINSQCSPANKIARFEYDGLQRLLNVKDEKGDIVKNYKYNYGPDAATTNSTQTLFYNIHTQTVFYKQGCPAGSVAQPYTYIVPYGKYASVISQTEANAKATAEIAANGQTTANQNGLCYFWNELKSQRFFKNNCQPWEGSGLAYFYRIYPNTYFSLISIADANAMALADISANGQNAANTYGGCSCTAEGLRMINGVCEQGQITYVGYEYAPGCEPGKDYRCYFQYYFSDGYHSPTYQMCSALPCQNY